MPIDDFVSWSKEIEQDRKIPNTVLFTNTARCASTLFGSMLQHEGKSIVLGEPHVLSQLSAGQSEGLWTEEVNSCLLIMKSHLGTPQTRSGFY